jgi:hypothetical protein
MRQGYVGTTELPTKSFVSKKWYCMHWEVTKLSGNSGGREDFCQWWFIAWIMPVWKFRQDSGTWPIHQPPCLLLGPIIRVCPGAKDMLSSRRRRRNRLEKILIYRSYRTFSSFST